MPNPFSNFIRSLQQRLEEQQRHLHNRKVNRERAQRQDEVLKSAAGQKAARQRAFYFQSLRRSAAQRRASLADALHWDSLRRRGREFGGGPGKPKLRRFGSRLVYAIAACSVLANVVLYMRWSPSRPLLTVGKHAVSKREYEATLDTAAGKAVLSQIVLAEVIRQAAVKAGVTPTAADIDARIALMKRRGVITAANMPTTQSIGQALALENLRVVGIPATDAEIAAEYAKHSTVFSQPAQMNATLVIAQTNEKAVQAAHLLESSMTPEGIAATPGLRVDGIAGFAVPPGALAPGLRQAMLAQKDRSIRVYPVQGGFLVLRANSHTAGARPPLTEVRSLVAREVRLQKAPTQAAEVLSLYAANRPVFDMTNYQPYLSDIDAAASQLNAKPAAPAKTASLQP